VIAARPGRPPLVDWRAAVPLRGDQLHRPAHAECAGTGAHV